MEGQQGGSSLGSTWWENFRFRKCDAARKLPPKAEPIACGQLTSSRQQIGGADRRTVNNTRAPIVIGIITPHLPCFRHPIYPQKEANKMEIATKTFSNLASVKIVPPKIGKSMRSHGIRMQ